jgi:signal transduction histidine kinase
VHFQASETRLPIVTRPQALRRVMTNLLDNALKFGERAAIAIDDSSDSEVVIHIIDDGPGIPEAELEAVCSRFIGLKHRATAIPAEQDSAWRLPRSSPLSWKESST